MRAGMGRGGVRDERWLSGVWSKQSFDRRRLRTTSGLSFKVVFPGLCTGGAGPDFRDAILALPDGSLLRGDVELHLESSGWRHHGHQRDAAYDRVLLHVVLEDDEPARNSRGEPLLTLELAGRLGPRRVPSPPVSDSFGAPLLSTGLASSPLWILKEQTAADGGLPASAPPLQAKVAAVPTAGPASTESACRVLSPVGRSASAPSSELTPALPWPAISGHAASALPEGARERLGAPAGTAQQPAPLDPGPVVNARQHGLEPAEASRGQLSYVVAPCQHALPRREPAAISALISTLALERFSAKQALIEGELAVFEPEQVLYASLLEALGYSRNRAPFRKLAQVAPLAAARCVRSAEAIRELLLEAAGLARAGGHMASLGLIGPPLDAAEWQTVGVRPDNLPTRRIAQVAALLERLAPAGMLDELLAPLLDLDGDTAQLAGSCGGQDDTAAVGQRLADLDAGRRQALLLRAGWREQLAELGRQRADAIAVNVLLPFAAAYGQATCQFLLSEAAVRAFTAYPAEGANHVTSYMRREILRAAAAVASGAAGEQGLLHVWDRWCHQKVCALCPLGSRSAAKEP